MQHRATQLTVGRLFAQRARIRGRNAALTFKGRTISYAELNGQSNRIAHFLKSLSVQRGDRIAVLSENRPEFVMLQIAAAKLGVAVACLNWRQSDQELRHCSGLVGPRLVFASPRFEERLSALDEAKPAQRLILDSDLLNRFQGYPDAEPDAEMAAVGAEDIWAVLYTSGTTGWPKGAAISHRAMIARAMIGGLDGAIFPERDSVVWGPMFHIAGTDNIMMTLLHGGSIILMDGYDPAEIVRLMVRQPVGILPLMPATITPLLEELSRTAARPQSLLRVGNYVDLVPPDQIEEVTTRLQAPFRNTFGSTETGLAPASKGIIPVGMKPIRFSKVQSSLCEVRLLNDQGMDVEDGEPGEVAVRGPSLFSGYWGETHRNEEVFRGGFYRMGDVLRRNPDGTLDFVDRKKYLIKSGGENIYPAEIERVLLASPRIRDAAVVRQADKTWGEVPVAFVVRTDATLGKEEVLQMCRSSIARYKCPKDVVFIEETELPRTALGKIQRGQLEQRLVNQCSKDR